MVGDLGSQVEHAAAASQGNHPADISTSGTSATSSETPWPDHRLALLSQSASGDPRTTCDGVQTGSGMARGASESPQVSNEFGEVVVASNGDLVIEDRFWTVFCKEVEHIYEAVHGPTATHFNGHSSSSTMSMSGNRPHNDFYNFLLRNTSAAHQWEDLHPLPSQMLFLWQVYMDNVDPFMKVLHVPTMTKVIRELSGSYHSFGPSMQALVLVISLAAVMSLEDEEVHVNFKTDKDQLVARYRLGTEQALEQADFLNNPDIIVLQALTIYLGVLQHTGETRSAWFLAGVLIRVTVSMKLHRDGSHFASITPFDIEMRRRLWWQICFVDSRSEDMQLSLYKLSEGMFDTDIPANTDDADLDPGMSKPPVVAERWTDMTVFLIHCEVWKLSRRLQSVTDASYALPPDIGERLKLFQQSQARIEDTYLKHVNLNQPLHSFVATMARLFLTKVDLILQTKQRSVRATGPQPADTPQSDKVFMSSLSIIEYTYALQNEPGWSGWSWQIQDRQPPWHALRIVLGQLCTRRWGPIYERAWSSAKRSFDSLPEADPRYQQLLVLTSAVQRNRADELHHQTCGSSMNAHVDLTSATALTLSAPLAQVGISGTVSTWTPQEPFLVMADDSNNNAFSDVLGLEMDWQVWDDIAGELEPSLEFWDIGGL
ncbi:Transcription factor domain, fungi [Lasallia pustulata]|uniref:Transcription factor domain, fungi n=1 Tax=Lasallia pustulata TaxID=136370 RepID=A0A1W5DB93_9LECA|nr:Transcription factor domain, fungi [Lasallia pustulata]